MFEIISENAFFFKSTWHYLALIVVSLLALSCWVCLKSKLSAARKLALTTVLIAGIGVVLSVSYIIEGPLSPAVKSYAKVQNSIGAEIELEFKDLRTNSRRRLSDYKGKNVILNFWATYCPPCVKEFKDLKEVENKKGTVVIALSDETEQQVREFISKYESPTIVGSFIGEKWIDLESFRPFTVFITKEGRIHGYAIGLKNKEYFHQVLRDMEQNSL